MPRDALVEHGGLIFNNFHLILPRLISLIMAENLKLLSLKTDSCSVGVGKAPDSHNGGSIIEAAAGNSWEFIKDHSVCLEGS